MSLHHTADIMVHVEQRKYDGDVLIPRSKIDSSRVPGCVTVTPLKSDELLKWRCRFGQQYLNTFDRRDELRFDTTSAPRLALIMHGQQTTPVFCCSQPSRA